jgi:hypothetical protein
MTLRPHRETVIAFLAMALLAAAPRNALPALPFMTTAPGSSAACGAVQPTLCLPGANVFTTYPPASPITLGASGAGLGLQAGDVINALSSRDELWDFGGDTRIRFSVRSGALGVAGVPPDVASEAAAGEAHADIFDAGTFASPQPNVRLVDGDGQPAGAAPALGLAEPGDELSALATGRLGFQAYADCFSLAPGSPTLTALGANAATILTDGPPVQILRTHLQLGLDASDVIDALSVSPTGNMLYSLAAGSPTLSAIGAGPGDILRYDDGIPAATVAIPANAIGLAPGDDLDALDVSQDDDGDLANDFGGDNCIGLANNDQKDFDSDFVGDACDTCTDRDHDGYGDPGFPLNVCQTDNCPDTFNASQADSDGDGVGDACDACPGAVDATEPDSDGDGVLDACDTCPGQDDGDPTTPCPKLYTLEGYLGAFATYGSTLRMLNVHSMRTLYSVEPQLAGSVIVGGRGLAIHPTTGALYALLALGGQGGHQLVTVDPVTGSASSIGDTGDLFVALSFDGAGTLYGVTSESTVGLLPTSLYTLDVLTAAPTFVMSLASGGPGEGIAFRPADGRLYHLSGFGSAAFESVDTTAMSTSPIALSGDVPLLWISSVMAYWPDQDAFLASMGSQLLRVSASGFVSKVGGVIDHLAGSAAFTTGSSPPLCTSTPLMGCRLGTLPRKSKLQLKGSGDPAKRQLKWKWNKGAATALGDYKDPVGGSAAYRVCLYDGSGAAQPLVSAAVAAGGICGTKPCWAASGSTGFKYANKAAQPDGIVKLKLKAGVAGKAQVQALGKGSLLSFPGLPLALPVTAQLVAADGLSTECWQTTFTEAQKNDATGFKALGP